MGQMDVLTREGAVKAKKSGMQHFGEAVRGGIDAYQQYNQQKQQNQQIEAENNAIKKLTGMDPSGIQDPKMRQEMLAQSLKGQQDKRSFQNEIDQESKNYETIEKTFGKKFADVWKSSPQGGRTALVQHALEASSRGQDLNNILSSVDSENPKQEVNQIPKELPQIKNGNIPEDFNWPVLDKRPQGYTPKEWNDEKKTWRKENAPIFEQNNTKLENINADILGTKKLSALNKSQKLPEGVERYLINPETGEFYGLAQIAGLVSPEVQEWVKTISRFQNRAKDTFGSRVTNFDLQSYMKQFPGLMNTDEGRTRILRMMDINYDLDKQYSSALKKVYQKYGLSRISQEDADELARGMVKNETDRLKTEYLGLDSQNQQSFQEKTGLSGKTIDVMGPDGQMYEIDQSEAGQLPEGFRIQ